MLPSEETLKLPKKLWALSFEPKTLPLHKPLSYTGVLVIGCILFYISLSIQCNVPYLKSVPYSGLGLNSRVARSGEGAGTNSARGAARHAARIPPRGERQGELGMDPAVRTAARLGQGARLVVSGRRCCLWPVLSEQHAGAKRVWCPPLPQTLATPKSFFTPPPPSPNPSQEATL